ncbi:MAG TPA: hypothetical protein VG247_17055 [Pseudonocardiaceae bacterium]|nr:hypothetical protein [Pseudonocardiaceae bacterium]
MGNWIKRTVVAVSVLAFGFAAQTASASAAPVHPMTFDDCGVNGHSGVHNCAYIAGGGLTATEIRGWSTDFGTAIANNNYQSILVHEQVSGPNGTICNSPTYNVSDPNQIVSCQLQPGGAFPIAAGNYCAIVWEFLYTNHYLNLAENCGNAS